jgi:hypothetical protein
MPFPAAANLYTSYSDNGDPTDPAAFRSGRQQQRFEQIQGDVMLDAQRKRETEAAEAEHRKNLAGTMAGDVTAWMNDPRYQTGYAQEPQEFKQHMIDAYGPVSADVPQVTNEAARAATGNPMLGVDTSKVPANSQYRINAQGQPEIVGENPRAPQELVSKAIDAGIPTVEQNTGRAYTSEELEKSLGDYYKNSGVLPPIKEKQLSTEATKYRASSEFTKAYQAASSMGNFLATFDDAMSNPNAANGIAQIDNFIRTNNPGGIVRQSTMNVIMSKMALLQKANADYISGHLTEGQFLPKKFMQEMKDSLMSEAAVQSRMFDAAVRRPTQRRLQQAAIPQDRMEGEFPNPYEEALSDYQKQQQSQTDPYQQALEWLKDHPNDPQAAAVREMLARKGL